ncbi:MAG: hypothetical protein ACLVL7_02735 [Anaerotruncus massiliensis (ex Togo et al. 2019)]
MAIPADVTARARAALSMLRDDRADIVRFDSDAGEDIRVYTGLPCHYPLSGEDGVSTVRHTRLGRATQSPSRTAGKPSEEQPGRRCGAPSASR